MWFSMASSRPREAASSASPLSVSARSAKLRSDVSLLRWIARQDPEAGGAERRRRVHRFLHPVARRAPPRLVRAVEAPVVGDEVDRLESAPGDGRRRCRDLGGRSPGREGATVVRLPDELDTVIAQPGDQFRCLRDREVGGSHRVGGKIQSASCSCSGIRGEVPGQVSGFRRILAGRSRIPTRPVRIRPSSRKRLEHPAGSSLVPLVLEIAFQA